MKKIILLVFTLLFSTNIIASERLTPVVKAAQKVSEGVVYIQATGTKARSGPFKDPFIDGMVGFGGKVSVEGHGAGAIVTSDGYILTSFHVVESAQQIKVTLQNKKVLPAALVSYDTVLDIAVLKIDGGNYKYIQTGDSRTVMQGETMLAFGSPHGFADSLTTGIVSNPLRAINSNKGFTAYIQTDAPLNHGNSGGPLINLDGELVGINNVIYQENGAINISFATPINHIKRILPEMIKGKYQNGSLGMTLVLENKNSTRLKVGTIKIDSDAYNKVRSGDVLISLDGVNIDSIAAVDYVLHTFLPNQKVDAVFTRDGKEYKVSFQLM